MTSLGSVFSVNWMRAKDKTDPEERVLKVLDAGADGFSAYRRDVEVLTDADQLEEVLRLNEQSSLRASDLKKSRAL